MLLKKITAKSSNINNGFAYNVWLIYYDKNPSKIYIANIEQKEIINIFIKTNLCYVNKLQLTMVEFHLRNSITYICINEKDNIYLNEDAIYLKLNNNKIYEVLEDDEGNEFYKETKNFILL